MLWLLLCGLCETGARPLFSGGANGLTISPAGSLKLNDEHGRVGVGVVHPKATLHVSRAARVQGAAITAWTLDKTSM